MLFTKFKYWTCFSFSKTQVAKYTDSEAMEFETVRTATERTREILESIDKQVIS